jgi:hypothetical protein
MAKKGPQSLYTENIAAEICERIARGETLAQICRDTHMPERRTVVDWVLGDREGFAARYAQARDLQLEHWADEITEIADDGTNDWVERETKSGRVIKIVDQEAVIRSRLRIDTKKWLLSKLKPERYGESLKLSGTLDLGTKTDEQLAARLTQLLAKAGSDSDPGGDGAAEEAP